MSLMERIFGSPAPAAAPATQTTQQTTTVQQPQPGNIPPEAGATNPDNPTVPANSQTSDDPLANFADLWQPAKQQAGTEMPLFGNVDPKKLMEVAQKTDFSKAIPKDALVKIQAGGADAVEAFSTAMNQVAQTVFANNALTTAKLLDQALARQQQTFEAKLPSLVKQHSVSDTLRSENPAFSNPAVQPLIQALELKLAQKHPQATASELTGMAKQYLQGISTVFNPQASSTEKAQVTASLGEDWDNWGNT